MPHCDLKPAFAEEKANFLQNTLVPAAIARWAELLSVQPIAGNLFAHRECSSQWTSFTPYKCASYATQTTCAETGDGIIIPFDEDDFGEDIAYTSSGAVDETLPAGTGIPDADFAVFVTAQQTSSCGSQTLAYAATCQRDSLTDRPTFGRINFVSACRCSASYLAWQSAFYLGPRIAQSRASSLIAAAYHTLPHDMDRGPLLECSARVPSTPQTQAGIANLGLPCTSSLTHSAFRMPPGPCFAMSRVSHERLVIPAGRSGLLNHSI